MSDLPTSGSVCSHLFQRQEGEGHALAGFKELPKTSLEILVCCRARQAVAFLGEGVKSLVKLGRAHVRCVRSWRSQLIPLTSLVSFFA